MNAVTPNNAHLLADVFTSLVSVEASKFDNLMREVLGGTKKGKRIIEDLISDISNSTKYDEIDNTLSVENNNDYFTPEELIGDENELIETSTFSAGEYSYDAPAFLDAETADHSSIIRRSIEDGLD